MRADDDPDDRGGYSAIDEQRAVVAGQHGDVPARTGDDGEPVGQRH